MFLYAWFLYYLDRYEREPLKLLAGMFFWGALIAASGAFVINSISSIGIYLITQNEFVTQLATSTLIAPLVEETLKGLAILIVYILFKPEFDSPLDGIVYAGIAALGFAASENTWYIHQFGYLSNGFQGLMDMSLIRVVLVGWQHPFYTAFTGLGFALGRQAKGNNWQFLFPIIGWFSAVVFHLLHNLFSVLAAALGKSGQINTIWDWSGYIGMLILILFLIKREQNWMKTYLMPEKDLGVIGADQYQIACSAWRQSLTNLRSLIKGNSSQVRLYYQKCGDLMHKIRQHDQDLDEPGISQEIERLREELLSLADEI